MTVLALYGALSTGLVVSLAASWWLKLTARRNLAALIRREPGMALAACDDRGRIAEDDGWGDGWTVEYEPGSLGPHPEARPDLPGRIRTRRRHVDRLLLDIEASQRVDAERRGHTP